MAHLVPILKDQALEWREVIEPFLASFIERGKNRYNVDDIFNQVTSGLMQMWVAMEDHVIQVVTITQVREFPNGDDFVIIMCVGEDRTNWLPLINALEEIAKDNFGCKRFVIECRLGWERELKHYGYEKTHIKMEKEL